MLISDVNIYLLFYYFLHIVVNYKKEIFDNSIEFYLKIMKTNEIENCIILVIQIWGKNFRKQCIINLFRTIGGQEPINIFKGAEG